MPHVYPPTGVPTPFSLEYGLVPTPLPDAEKRLHGLAEDLYADLEVLSYPSRTWNYCRDPEVLEVAIIGAGHGGKSAAFGLRRHGVERVLVFDRNPPGQEGPWRTFARNATLRTPKIVTGGLDWGIPNLNFRRWCSARYGEAYWHRIQFIPRLIWAEYLDWYSEVLNLPIQNDTDIRSIVWNSAENCFWLQAQYQGSPQTYKARFLIFAGGMECAGGKYIPAIVRESLPDHCYFHTMDDIPFASLTGRRIVIVGGGASAFDTALVALEAGVKAVDIVMRRSQMPDINRIRWSEWNGYHRHYIDLPDELKWYYTLSEFRLGQLPPPHTYFQASSDPRLTLYTGAPVKKLSYEKGEIVGLYGDLTLRHHQLICGTGFVTDLDHQQELQELAPHIARWRDHYQPPPGEENEEMARYPYLGPSLEFLPQSPDHRYLKRCYYLSSGGALLSGFRANLSGLQFALPRILYDIGRQLFLEHQDEIRMAFDQYDVREF